MSKGRKISNYYLYTKLATVFSSLFNLFNSVYYYRKIKREKEKKILRDIMIFSMSNH